MREKLGSHMESVISAIRSIEEEYQQKQALILTESDLQCIIYHKLYRHFSNAEKIIDKNIEGIALHGEISWYDEHGMLRIRPDITILNPSRLSIKQGISLRMKGNRFAYGVLPRKGCVFHGGAIIIEAKFVRKKKGITETDIRKFDYDIRKILSLFTRLRDSNAGNDLYGILVVFNRTNKGKRLVDELRSQYSDNSRLHLLYGTGKVEF